MVYLNYIKRYPWASLAVLFILVPLALSWRNRTYLDRSFRLLAWFLLLNLLTGLWMLALAAHRSNTLLILNLFVPLRYALFAGVFYVNFRSAAVRRAILISVFAFVPFALLDIYVSNRDLSDLHNHLVGKYAQVVESVLVIFWAMRYFFELIQRMEVNDIVGFPFLWVCAGLLIFYTGNVFYFPFWTYTNTWDNDLDLGWIEDLPSMVEIVTLCLFSVGIWLTRPYHDHDRLHP